MTHAQWTRTLDLWLSHTHVSWERRGTVAQSVRLQRAVLAWFLMIRATPACRRSIDCCK